MKFIGFAISFLCAVVFSGAKPVPSGPLKVYNGPEGEIVAMVEVNSSKEMLVFYKNVGGELEGKSKLYLVEDQGKKGRSLFYNKKKGSKMVPWYMLSNEKGNWHFSNPSSPGTEISLTYSKTDTNTFKIDDVINAYQP